MLYLKFRLIANVVYLFLRTLKYWFWVLSWALLLWLGFYFHHFIFDHLSLLFYLGDSCISISVFSLYLTVCNLKCSNKYRFASEGSTSGKEKTLAIVKPDGLFGNYTDRIKNVISNSGFTICKERIIQLDEESVMSFYAEHSSRSFFGSLVKYMTRYVLNSCRRLLILWQIAQVIFMDSYPLEAPC